MRIVIFTLLFIILAAGLAAQDLALFDSALVQVGQTTADIRFDQDEMAVWGGDFWRLRYFTMFHKNPFKLPKYADLNMADLSKNAADLNGLLGGACRRIDHPIRRGLIGDQLTDYLNHPDSIPKASVMNSKNVLNGAQYKPLREKIDLLYRVAEDEDHFFSKALKEVDNDKHRNWLFEHFIGDEEEPDDRVYELVDKINFSYLYSGAQDIAEVVNRIADSLDQLPFPSKMVEVQTRQGLIVVGTSGIDKYTFLEPPLLIIDGGGDDEYKFSGTNSSYPLTVIIDLAGNDRYISTDKNRPGIGGAVLGMSVLIDKAGDDIYEGINLAYGSGLFGVGLLMDNSGDDLYTGQSLVQGAGVFGIGILADSAGNDSL